MTSRFTYGQGADLIRGLARRAKVEHRQSEVERRGHPSMSATQALSAR
jgi:hypothetical protein